MVGNGDMPRRLARTIRAGNKQALQNLAANAIRYAPRGSSVRLASRLETAPGLGEPPGDLPWRDLAEIRQTA